MAPTPHVVAVETTSRPRQCGYEASQLRLERRLHAGSPHWGNNLVSAGPAAAPPPGSFFSRACFSLGLFSGRWTMPRFWRQSLIVTMLALYGLVSLCGSGLHARWSRGPPMRRPGEPDEAKGPRLEAMSGHCPICEFQAQGQLAVEPARVVSRPRTAPHVVLILALVASRDRHPSCSPAPLRSPFLTLSDGLSPSIRVSALLLLRPDNSAPPLPARSAPRPTTLSVLAHAPCSSVRSGHAEGSRHGLHQHFACVSSSP